MRSATANTSFMLWETISTARPWSARRRTSSSTIARLRHAECRRRLVHDHELRVPQHGLGDRRPTAAGRRTARPRVGGSSAPSSPRGRSASRAPPSPSPPRRAGGARVASRPRNMFWTMSRLSQSARSWYTVSIPSAAASEGARTWTGRPSHRISPAVGAWMPEMVLIEHRLAGAVVADERGHLPGRHVEVDAVQRPDGAEALAHAPQLEQRRGPARPGSARRRLSRSRGDSRCGALRGARRRRGADADFTNWSLITVSSPCSRSSPSRGQAGSTARRCSLVVRSWR